MPISWKPTPKVGVNGGSLWTDDDSVWDEVCELAKGSSENFNDNGLDAKVTLLVPGSYRFDVVSDILFHFLEYPYLPGSGLYLVAFQLTPFSPLSEADGKGLTFAQYKLNLTFSAQAYQDTPAGAVNELVTFTEELTETSSIRSIPSDIFQWTNEEDARPLKRNEAPGFQEYGFDYKLTQHFINTLPNAMLGTTGTTNKNELTSPSTGLVFPPETLLMGPKRARRTWSRNGANAWNLTLSLKYKPTGWNTFYNSTKFDPTSSDQSHCYEKMYIKAGVISVNSLATEYGQATPVVLSAWNGLVNLTE